MHLPRAEDLRQEITKAYENDSECALVGILLVPDNISARKENKLIEKYTPEHGKIKLTGALWFYLSLYYIYEMPKEIFYPSRQRELIDRTVDDESSSKA